MISASLLAAMAVMESSEARPGCCHVSGIWVAAGCRSSMWKMRSRPSFLLGRVHVCRQVLAG
jgi:hypothetical protein